MPGGTASRLRGLRNTPYSRRRDSDDSAAARGGFPGRVGTCFHALLATRMTFRSRYCPPRTPCRCRRSSCPSSSRRRMATMHASREAAFSGRARNAPACSTCNAHGAPRSRYCAPGTPCLYRRCACPSSSRPPNGDDAAVASSGFPGRVGTRLHALLAPRLALRARGIAAALTPCRCRPSSCPSSPRRPDGDNAAAARSGFQRSACASCAAQR